MKPPIQTPPAGHWAPQYPTVDHVSEQFMNEMHSLYLLGFLLVADPAMAEECLIAILDDSAEGAEDFLVWAKTSARLAIIREAIRIIRPTPFDMNRSTADQFPRLAPEDCNKPFSAIVSLGNFERFAFVMSEFEGWCDEECAALLGCTGRDVVIAREVAKRSLGTNEIDSANPRQFEYSVATVPAQHPCCGTW